MTLQTAEGKQPYIYVTIERFCEVARAGKERLAGDTSRAVSGNPSSKSRSKLDLATLGPDRGTPLVGVQRRH
jgi:hypothetical protein